MNIFGRKAIPPSNEGPVTDLDAIVAEPVPFRFKGKIHYLKPIDLQHFLKFTNAQDRLMRSAQDSERKLSPKDLAEQYLAVISPLCATITLDDILSMEQIQVAALYQLVIDMVTGQVEFQAGSKKKRSKLQIYDTVGLSSSPNAPESLAGPH